MKELVISAIGPDRVGLVKQITGYLHDMQANIADSRMVNLRGQFALILLVEVADTATKNIAQGVVELGNTIGMTIYVKEENSETANQRANGLALTLKVFAMDQPGIVHRVTHLLHQQQVNIEELETRLEAGAHSGTPLFSMHMTMTVPRETSVKLLRESLEQLCNELNCDFELAPPKNN